MAQADKSKERTMVDVLKRYVGQRGTELAYRMLGDGDFEEGACWSFNDLGSYAADLAGYLGDRIKEQERALLLYPPGLDFIGAIVGCFTANVIAVPAYPPDPTRLDRTLPRLQAIVRDAAPAVVLTTSTIRDAFRTIGGMVPELMQLTWIATDELPPCLFAEAVRPPRPSDIALLQYTSGSTGTPTGVIISHENLLHNERQIKKGFGHTDEGTGFTWLPVYHDMGLIGNVLQALYCGRPITMMSPIDFLQKPLRWLQAITRFRVTSSGGPNFAFDLCSRKISREEIDTLDLSTWEVAFCGAEPVRPHTLTTFADTFARAGFRRTAFYPCFGLAEATLFVTGSDLDAEPTLRAYQGSRSLGDESACDGIYVSCGRPADGQQVRIVDPRSNLDVVDGEKGEIWVSGPNVATGYWGNPKESAMVFSARTATGDGPYLRTGDLGFVVDGELFVTGRLKDVIIVHGVNHHPEDIELTVEKSHGMVRPGCSAVFAIATERDDKVVAAVEMRDQWQSHERQDIVRAIRSAVSRQHGVALGDIALVQARTLPKTSSGKIQRFRCRELYMTDKLDLEVTSSIAEPRDSRNVAPYEEEVMIVLSATTGSPDVRSDADFFGELGGESVQAVEVVAQLNDRYGTDLPLRAVYDFPTPRELAAFVDRHINDMKGSPDTASDAARLFFESEAVSPIAPIVTVPTKRALEGEILVTGATGSFGPYLVAELLEQTSARLRCLVRAKSDDKGYERLRRSLENAKRWRAEYGDRIQPVIGDLGLARFGLDNPGYQRLAQEITAIVHNGAYVDFLHTYARMRPANVLGTKEIVRFAVQRRVKPLFYTSTIGVFNTSDGNALLCEDEEASGVERMFKGYAQTKWVAEQTVAAAVKCGLPATIFRVGLVSGDSVSGLGAGKSLVDRIIISCVQMGIVPDIKMTLDMVPVDYVARAWVHLAAHVGACGQTYHLTHPHGIGLPELYEWMNGRGYEVKPVSYLDVWRPAALAAPRDNALYALRAFIEEAIVEPVWGRFDSKRALMDLAGSGIACPQIDDRLLALYLAQYEKEWNLPLAQMANSDAV